MMIRLLGRHPVDGVADRRVAEIFAASHAIRPVGKSFDDLLSDMNELALEAHVKEIVAAWPDLSQRGEKEEARQSLIDLVEGEIERVWAIAAEHDENIKDQPARTRARKGFVHSKEANAMRQWFVRAKGSVERGGKDRDARCGGGGPVADGGSNAGLEVGRETRADGTRSVPATPNGRGRGWDSVVVEESEVLACGGYLPENYIGIAGEGDAVVGGADEVSNTETGNSDREEAGPCEPDERERSWPDDGRGTGRSGLWRAVGSGGRWRRGRVDSGRWRARPLRRRRRRPPSGSPVWITSQNRHAIRVMERAARKRPNARNRQARHVDGLEVCCRH